MFILGGLFKNNNDNENSSVDTSSSDSGSDISPNDIPTDDLSSGMDNLNNLHVWDYLGNHTFLHTDNSLLQFLHLCFHLYFFVPCVLSIYLSLYIKFIITP